MRQKGFAPILIIFIIVSLLFVAYLLGIKRLGQQSDSQTSPTPQNENYQIYTDPAGVYSLEIPKNFIPNILSTHITDSCVVLADYTFVQPDASEEQMKALRDKGVLIHVCYTATNLEGITDELKTSQRTYSITSSTPTTVNEYNAFKINAKSSDIIVNDMIVIKSPYQGYVVIHREANGKEIYNNILKSFVFIKPGSK